MGLAAGNKTDSKFGSGFGANQQISVAAIFAIFIGLLAIGLGYFPLTNTYSLLFGGVALLIAARAALYAISGTVYARGMPVVAVIFTLIAMTFCIGWPYVGDRVNDMIDEWRNPAEPEPAVTQPETTLDAAAEARRKADIETYRKNKEEMLKQKAKEATEAEKPPKPPE